jgi:hypothetical protein
MQLLKLEKKIWNNSRSEIEKKYETFFFGIFTIRNCL